MPTKARYLHEMALRILLHSLETSACRYRRHIVPIISCGIDFYIRVFVRVYESAAEVCKIVKDVMC
jgi:tRNA (guanine26-N2/guanine27-N2)-dimethyltransferase